jgi:hypothetical protein
MSYRTARIAERAGRTCTRTSTRAAMSLAALVITVAFTSEAGAQQSVTSEFWPEVDVYWTPAKHQRTFLELGSSSEREGPKREATIGLYQDYLSLPRYYLRGGYRFTFSTRDASYRESRGVAEAAVRIVNGATWRLVERTRLELRWFDSEYSYRVRERLHLQRFPPTPWKWDTRPYATAEAYYDSRYNTIARLGARVGVEFRLWKESDIDIYLARQENSRGEPARVNALGVTLKLYR